MLRQRHAALFFTIVLASTVVAACNGGSHSGVTPAVKGVVRHSRSVAPPNTATSGGQITSVPSGTDFAIHSSSCGYQNVSHNSSTHFDPAGSTPAVNEYAQVTGTQSSSLPCNNFTSSSYITIANSAIGTVNASGTVSTVNTDGTFVLTNGSTSNTVILNSYKDAGIDPIVGQTASVTGYGIPGNGHFIHATSVTLTSPSGAAHVRTFAYGGAAFNQPSTAAKYVDWIQTDHNATESQVKGAQAAGMNVMLYVDLQVNHTDYFYSGGYLKSAADWSYIGSTSGSGCTPTGTITTVVGSSPTLYITNPQSATFQSDYANFVASVTPNVGPNGLTNWNAVLEDGSGPFTNSYQTFSTPLPCNWSANSEPATWDGYVASDEEHLFSTDKVPTILNGLDGRPDTHYNNLSANIGVFSGNMASIGGRFDGCYSQQDTGNQKPIVDGSAWIQVENTELKMATLSTANGQYVHPMFVCLSTDEDTSVVPVATPGPGQPTPSPTAAANPVRLFVIASFLLSYDTTNTPSTSSLWETFDYSSGNELEAFPEEQLVVGSPVVATPTDVSSLKMGSVYAREYKNCWLAGTYVGPCAVAVNPSGISNSNPLAGQYTRTLVLTGGDNLDGGTASDNGPAPNPTMAPDEGVVMFR